MARSKWRIGTQITHKAELASRPMGIGHNSFAVLPEAKGKASVATVDESGYIGGWIMRHVPIRDALTFLNEKGKPKNWEPY